MASNNGVFPELVLDIGPSTSRTTGAVPPSPLAQTVENALREVLAWRPRVGDSKGFTAALNQVFTIDEVDGHTTFAWTPRSYAVQADMGAVTGAQASIFSRAKAALDQSVPLIEGLFALRPDDDTEDTEANRAVVISKFTELVNELGVVGGPRLQRVDDYFLSLLGANSGDNPEAVEGLFGQMREEFGFERDLINTVDEEQNLTNYLIVVDHVVALRRSWNNLRHFFDHKGSDVFLGTQLVQLSRALGVVAESVEELYFVMDSVFLGAAERQTVRLDSGLTIDELFSWVERFSTEEALQLIRDGGKDGVISFRPTIRKLLSLVTDAVNQSNSGSGNRQRGFHQPRTQAALEEVRRHLEAVVTLTEQLRRGPVVSVLMAMPNPAPPDIVRVTIEGRNFKSGAEAYLNEWGPGKRRINGSDENVVSPSEMKVTFDLRNEADTCWAVVVKNPGDAARAMAQPFKVSPAGPTTTPSTVPVELKLLTVSAHDSNGNLLNAIEFGVQSNVSSLPSLVVDAEVDHLIFEFSDDLEESSNIEEAVQAERISTGEPLAGISTLFPGSEKDIQFKPRDEQFDNGEYKITVSNNFFSVHGDSLDKPFIFRLRVLMGEPGRLESAV